MLKRRCFTCLFCTSFHDDKYAFCYSSGIELPLPKERICDGYVLCKQNGARYSDITNAYYDDLKKAGINRRVWKHDLRHTFASHAAMSGIDGKVLQELLGHKTPSMTSRYTHLNVAYKKMVIGKLDTRLNNGHKGMEKSLTLGELKKLFGEESDAYKKVQMYLEIKGKVAKVR